jgi:hypothetical protein
VSSSFFKLLQFEQLAPTPQIFGVHLMAAKNYQFACNALINQFAPIYFNYQPNFKSLLVGKETG